MLSRRSFLLGGAALATTGAVGAGVQQGVLPGRPWLQERLGLNGEAGQVPDIEPGRVKEGTFVSQYRLGRETGYSVISPPGAAGKLPVTVALHPLGADHSTLTGPEFGLDRFLAAHVAAGGEPFVIATVDGGSSYWHGRPDGEDAGSMVAVELLTLLAEQGHDLDRLGLLGWSMGGYGALHLAGQLGTRRLNALVAVSPAIWTDPQDASKTGFEDEAEYEEYTVMGHQEELRHTPVRIDCGTGDPFYRDVEDYVEGFPAGADVTATFEPGGHTTAYWRRMLPEQLAFLGRHLHGA